MMVLPLMGSNLGGQSGLQGYSSVGGPSGRACRAAGVRNGACSVAGSGLGALLEAPQGAEEGAALALPALLFAGAAEVAEVARSTALAASLADENARLALPGEVPRRAQARQLRGARPGQLIRRCRRGRRRCAALGALAAAPAAPLRRTPCLPRALPDLRGGRGQGRLRRRLLRGPCPPAQSSLDLLHELLPRIVRPSLSATLRQRGCCAERLLLLPTAWLADAA
eukprot:CAMPEP_0179199840 /NCGR_PEP_ID=MMETSP0796-20121207/99432_1 /TAXON_ID=73915 /ORGANISM="Pyrodinium bahamense, Strain pbaha01" /LENGTH=224 /DNA_ID=CAMNT_0020904353 /DNA_START=331 /DNA_END=1002 /DNA_ORIENTATION=-